MKNNLLILMGLTLLVSACETSERGRPTVRMSEKFLGVMNMEQFKPRAYRKQYFDHTPKGNDSYDVGFMDGCQTATSAMGSGLARIRGPKIDGNKLSSDPWYLRGFQDAATYCTLTLDWETH